MYRLKVIGMVVKKEQTIISINKDFRKALKYLGLFSHIHVFYLHSQEECETEKELKKDILKLICVDEKEGKIIAETKESMDSVCELVDIKPYFPSEDTVRDSKTVTSRRTIGIPAKQTKEEGSYQIEAIGQIRNVNGKQYIQLENEISITASYIKIYWWFHKFDAAIYRKATLCNPPYEDAPQTGIFATRSPVRPNPIAMTVAGILSVDQENRRIYISKVESFDKTPCIGIDEYKIEEDRILECSVPKWLEHWPKFLENQEETTAVTTKDTKVIKSDSVEELLYRQEKSEKENVEYNHGTDYDLGKPKSIMVHGARENNLRGIDVEIPYGKITAVVGVSGSGKSSLVNDTIYAECNRRMEYLNHSHNMPRPKVDDMRGCIPAVVINQDAIRGNAYSTVGTYTDAYGYLRNIYAAIALRHCPDCGEEIVSLSEECIFQLMEQQKKVTICNLNKEELKKDTLNNQIHTALEQGKGGFYAKLEDGQYVLLQTKQKCYHCGKIMFHMTPATFSYMDADSRCPVCNGTGKTICADERKIIDHPNKSLLEGASSFYGKLRSFLDNPNANWMKGQIFGLADEMGVDLEQPWEELPKEFRETILFGADREVTFHYQNKRNGRTGEIRRPVEGICNIIERLHEENSDTHTLDHYMTKKICKACKGERLNKEGRMATIRNKTYPEAARATFIELQNFCANLKKELPKREYEKIALFVDSLREIAQAAVLLGIGYLQLSQDTGTLSGGEGQRLKLLGAFKNHISGILYVFDEPSKALHPDDYQKVKQMLVTLKNEGNTIIIVEHNEDMIRIADYVIEIGPGAGTRGGSLVGEGMLEAMLLHEGTQICRYMGNRQEIVTSERQNEKQDKKPIQQIKHSKTTAWKNNRMIHMEGLNCHNLKDISIDFPIHALTCLRGVSGSGKSSLMKGEIFEHGKREKSFSEVILVDQLPIGKTSKSIVATYIDIMDQIRNDFAGTEIAKQNNWDEKYFSFNGQAGQCETCKGEGRVKQKYMENTYIQCPDCKGKRYKRTILKVQYQKKNISEVLELTIDEAAGFFAKQEDVLRVLHSLQKVGLGYLKLGQGTSTLSGGEASRLKLAKELMTKKKGDVLYLLDEPTTGLHFSDVDHLMKLMEELIESGNTVVAIEHNKQFQRYCDWQIVLGPGAGKDGGTVLRQGEWERSY